MTRQSPNKYIHYDVLIACFIQIMTHFWSTKQAIIISSDPYNTYLGLVFIHFSIVYIQHTRETRRVITRPTHTTPRYMNELNGKSMLMLINDVVQRGNNDHQTHKQHAFNPLNVLIGVSERLTTHTHMKWKSLQYVFDFYK